MGGVRGTPPRWKYDPVTLVWNCTSRPCNEKFGGWGGWAAKGSCRGAGSPASCFCSHPELEERSDGQRHPPQPAGFHGWSHPRLFPIKLTWQQLRKFLISFLLSFILLISRTLRSWIIQRARQPEWGGRIARARLDCGRAARLKSQRREGLIKY